MYILEFVYGIVIMEIVLKYKRFFFYGGSIVFQINFNDIVEGEKKNFYGDF